jgi:hypothetical protein
MQLGFLHPLQAYDSAANTLKEAGNKISETVTGAQNSAGETAQQVSMCGHDGTVASKTRSCAVAGLWLWCTMT